MANPVRLQAMALGGDVPARSAANQFRDWLIRQDWGQVDRMPFFYILRVCPIALELISLLGLNRI